MSGNYSQILLLSIAILGFLDIAVTAPQPETNRVLYADSNNGNYKAGFSTYNGNPSHHDVLYGYAGSNKQDGVRFGAGFIDHSAMVTKNIGIKHKVGVLGAELDGGTNANTKVGAMARVTAIDGTAQIGPVGVNYGVNVDSGASFSKEGLEVKVLGIGAKFTSKEIEFCFIVCFGISF